MKRWSIAPRQRPFGFNETKITPFGGKAGTRAHVNGLLKQGLPELARAEAWEFHFDHGGIYDHWGYRLGGVASALCSPLATVRSWHIDRKRRRSDWPFAGVGL